MEFKLRQYNKNNKQFHYWGIINGEWVSPYTQDNYEHPCLSDQFTGRKDKNDIEIYVNDITTNGVVKMFENIIYDSWCASHPGFYFYNSDWDGELTEEMELDFCLGFDDKNLEILGNTHIGLIKNDN